LKKALAASEHSGVSSGGSITSRCGRTWRTSCPTTGSTVGVACRTCGGRS